ncbi:MAG: hypothetical protein WDM79_15490 [Terricaulis sp.]
MVLIGVALAIGMAGYHELAGLSWIDAFVNAAMLLGGMGPVSPLDNDAAKLFAGIYALVCGLLIVITSGVILAPILHRVLPRHACANRRRLTEAINARRFAAPA